MTLLKVEWEGPQLVNSSLALVNRYLCRELLRHGVHLKITPTEKDSIPDYWFSDAANIRNCYDAGVEHPLVHIRQQWPPTLRPSDVPIQILFQPWEYGPVPAKWVPFIQTSVDEVWVNSNYTRQGYIKSGIDEDKIFTFPLGIDTSVYQVNGPRYALKTTKSFVFLFVGGTIHRKGIDKVLEAYRRAFRRSDDVCLVVKDFGRTSYYAGQTYHEQILAASLDPESPEILYMDWDLTPAEMGALYRASNCLVHPYRAEGFGLPILEAMACGVPAIIPSMGPATEFTTEENSYRVKSQLSTMDMPSDMQLALPAEMIDVDMDHLVDTMIKAFSERKNHTAVCDKAARHAQQYSWEAIGEIVVNRIKILQEKAIQKPITHTPVELKAFSILRGVNERTNAHVTSSEAYAAILSHGLHEGDAILDIGPKTIDGMKYMQMKGACVTHFELSRVQDRDGDVFNLLADERLYHKTYDTVFIRHAIEMFQPSDAAKLLLALFEIMSYRGRIFIVTPDCDNTQVITKQFWTKPFNSRPYPTELLQLLLSEVGFRTITSGKMPGGIDALVFASRLANDNPFV
ncbi:glycosyl transferase group 1 [Alicyclobacillus hesperidum URH17-3-68]|uniref:glycosyltransferase n=1 Tax=Alicyclobacillus hesperidum TaxID=89784 RepID=UPI000281C2FB|nr:glycosyltransferase [Alicyclobacillus hesperidum]EJY54904.1 glycosyl transferase group 1 [Alicyclobacillus hesperidum URH17-3-68]